MQAYSVHGQQAQLDIKKRGEMMLVIVLVRNGYDQDMTENQSVKRKMERLQDQQVLEIVKTPGEAGVDMITDAINQIIVKGVIPVE